MLSPRTFSSRRARGRSRPHSSTAHANRSRSSVAPSWRPATVNGGHGTPPASRSTPVQVSGSHTVPVRYVPLGHLPGRPVRPQGGAGRRVQLDGQGVLETGTFEAQGLPACSGADLEDLKIGHAALLLPTAPATHLGANESRHGERRAPPPRVLSGTLARRGDDWAGTGQSAVRDRYGSVFSRPCGTGARTASGPAARACAPVPREAAAARSRRCSRRRPRCR